MLFKTFKILRNLRIHVKFKVKQNAIKLFLIMAVAGAFFRNNYLADRDKLGDYDTHDEIPTIFLHNDYHYQTKETETFHGQTLITKDTVKTKAKQSTTLTTGNNFLEKKKQNKETKLLQSKSEIAMTNESQSSPIYPLFQSADEEDFPTKEGHLPRIPHIIHQIYEDEMIPAMYINHVKSFIKYNPTWEYRFWTDESGRRLLQKHHPYLVQVYDNFGKGVMRSDLLRYAVLYEYGGFYADLDTENLRSLNSTTMKYACIVPVEPFEHSAFLYRKNFIINNAIMSCRPKHPFFKLLLSNLRWLKPRRSATEETGPFYVTKQYIQYNRIRPQDTDRNKTDWSSNSPYFYKGELGEEDDNAVCVPNTQYFTDNIDPIYFTKKDLLFTNRCKKFTTLPYLSQRACSELDRRAAVRKNKKYTYTVHHWYHLWMMSKSTVDVRMKTHISKVVPNFIPYNK